MKEENNIHIGIFRDFR